MKDLGKIKYRIGLQIEHHQNEIFLHQSNYTEKVLKCFNMDKTNPLSTTMVVRSLNVKKDLFHPHENDKKILSTEVPYLSAIGTLISC